MKNYTLAFIIYFSLQVSLSFSQIQVKGIVKNSTGSVLPNAKISSYNKVLGFSNAKGEFDVQVAPGLDSLKVSLPDYIIELIPVSTSYQNIILISLSESSIYELTLEEIMNIEINVSSTIGKHITQTPSNVYVIDSKVLADFNFSSVAEAIRIAAGVEILQSNIDANIPTIRGILQNYYSNKVLILINGIPNWQPIYGNGSLDRISVNDVERIEILKGPASVLYGTNAYNGVINIILRSNEESHVNAYASTGFPSLAKAGVNATLDFEDWHLFLALNSANENRAKYKFEGQRGQLYNGDSVFNMAEKINQHNFTAQLNYKAHQAFINFYNFNYTYPGIAPSYASGGNSQILNTGVLSEYRYDKNITDKLRTYFAISYEYFSRMWPDRADRSTTLQLAAERFYTILKFNYQFNEYIDIEAGGDYVNGNSLGHVQLNTLRDTVLRYNMRNAQNLIEYSGFGQINLTYRKFSLLAGSRFTINQTFDSNLSSRISGVYSLNESHSVKLMYGESFRTPTMLELYFDHPTVIGTSNLRPETSHSVELSYVGLFDKISIQSTVYHAGYHDLIYRVRPDNTKPAFYQNGASIEGLGFELENKIKINKFDGYLNYNYIQGIGNESDENFDLIPAHTLSLGLTSFIGKVKLNSNAYFYSSTKGLLDKIPPQFMLNAGVAYEHNFKGIVTLTHLINISNITGSQMLIPEYIRRLPNINALATTAYGTTIVYTLKVRI